MNPTLSRGPLWAVILVAAAFVSGCKSTPKPGSPRTYNLEVWPKGGADQMSIMVYIAPRKEFDAASLRPGEDQEGVVKYSLTGTKGGKVLGEKSAQFIKWKERRVTSLAVYADLPGVTNEKDKLKFIPLGSNCWRNLNERTIKIMVFPNRIVLEPDPQEWCE